MDEREEEGKTVQRTDVYEYFKEKTFERYPNAEITYGSETSSRRKELGLDKTHYNDAITISGIKEIKENPEQWFYLKQFRKKKRSLHEATPRKGRKILNRNQIRNSKNTKAVGTWYLGDKVKFNGKIGWISGFTGKSAAYVQDVEGKYVSVPNKSYKQVSLSCLRKINSINNWQYCYL